jgi:tRNA nucleotidyltransferase (CCA-adding enzyme)
MSHMKTYLVGGAVRDALLGKEVKDRDYVVIAGTAEQLLALGFEQVGMGFPVFLHPETGEEYALARREKKVGAGYTGFEFETSKDVLLVEDLERRDLTINSMAMDDDGTVVDPFGGRRDLKDKVLRHTSDAFGEDPLRVVRLARFYARYDGFSVADETMMLAAEMIARGDLNELPHERFWRELEKAFADPKPEKFFELLFELGAFEGVQFFRDLFGGNVSGARLSSYMELAKAVRRTLPSTEFMVDVFSAWVVPEDTKDFFNTARAGNLYVGLREFNRLGGPPTGVEVVHFLTKCRAWGMGTMADDIVAALAVHESATGQGPFYLPAWKLKACIEAGRSVKSEPYAHLEGKAIGQAMAAERAVRIGSLLR